MICILTIMSGANVALANTRMTRNDLAEDSKIHIGVKFQPEECTRKTEKFDRLTTHYTGHLYRSKIEFDSIHGRRPFSFTLGTGQVIKGWDLGLLDMCIGEVRRIVIPSEMGYGNNGTGNIIPPDATLIFDVELLGIE